MPIYSWHCLGIDSLICPSDLPVGHSSYLLQLIVFPIGKNIRNLVYCISSVQLLSHVRLFATPWTASCQASLSIINSQSLPELISIDSVMPSNHLTLRRPLLLPPSIFPSIRVFSNESALHIRWLKHWVSASTRVLPMNTQDCFLLGWTSWISLQSKVLSKVFSNTIVQKLQFLGTQLSL